MDVKLYYEKSFGELPNCFQTMNAEFLKYVPDESISVVLPVLEEHLNPGGAMQGGFITAAFDNVFGPLAQLTLQSFGVATIMLSTNYHRPIFSGDNIKITAEVKMKGRTMIHMIAEAYNNEGKLIATANTTYVKTN
ncbi:hypothetical protein SYNTR_1474 [Candidatus Syntrophocurvum alkaliphilum]|uniref:Thioesterase domain-containing protein n=1 Tax=Candidatus Syntrophocurvum alkaliphilum TaxID=2293317 RepID=A0A6I6DGD1_9FIRM|nr:PaaI family thioesterase [Candidatus Syntrophocurvum alkaliphilum]QGU00068.1 hypothetical protein SYNTR_1474 [Candidatus Syntrophocurvum alkaliphilum]